MIDQKDRIVFNTRQYMLLFDWAKSRVINLEAIEVDPSIIGRLGTSMRPQIRSMVHGGFVVVTTNG